MVPNLPIKSKMFRVHILNHAAVCKASALGTAISLTLNPQNLEKGTLKINHYITLKILLFKHVFWEQSACPVFFDYLFTAG